MAINLGFSLKSSLEVSAKNSPPPKPKPEKEKENVLQLDCSISQCNFCWDMDMENLEMVMVEAKEDGEVAERRRVSWKILQIFVWRC